MGDPIWKSLDMFQHGFLAQPIILSNVSDSKSLLHYLVLLFSCRFILSVASKFFLVLVGQTLGSLEVLLRDASWATHWLVILVQIDRKAKVFKYFVRDTAVFIHAMINSLKLF